MSHGWYEFVFEEPAAGIGRVIPPASAAAHCLEAGSLSGGGDDGRVGIVRAGCRAKSGECAWGWKWILQR